MPPLSVRGPVPIAEVLPEINMPVDAVVPPEYVLLAPLRVSVPLPALMIEPPPTTDPI